MFLKHFESSRASRSFSVIGVAVFTVVLLFSAHIASAAQQPLMGFAWSETIGWLSFNSANPGTGGVPYAVQMDDSNGNLSGYAWSENIGWVSFNAAHVTDCPVGICQPNVALTGVNAGKVTGWAKACAGRNDQSSVSAYVTSVTPGPTLPRNNYTGYIGMVITVGPTPLTVTQLGRYMLTGNSETHIVKLVTASNGQNVAGGSVLISMSGATVGQFKYVTLASPVILAAATTYYVVSEERLGGDTWHHSDTVITTTAAATESDAVYGTTAGGWSVEGGSNHSFSPVNIKYSNVPLINQTVPNNTCTGWDRTDGWDGWIELSGTNHTSGGGATTVTYNSTNFVSSPISGNTGVTYNSSTGLFSGVAWGSDVVGWMDFSGVAMNGATLEIALVDDSNALINGGSSRIDSDVLVDFNTTNSKQKLLARGSNYTVDAVKALNDGRIITGFSVCNYVPPASPCVPSSAALGVGLGSLGLEIGIPSYRRYSGTNLPSGVTRAVFRYGAAQPTVILEARPNRTGTTFRSGISDAVGPTEFIVLQWTVTNVNSCTAVQGTPSWAAKGPLPLAVNTSFITTDTISAETTFAIFCTDNNGVDLPVVTVTVPLLKGTCNAYSEATGNTTPLTSAAVGVPVWWVVKPEPPAPISGSYSYAWSGSDNLAASLTANTQSVQKTYRTVGLKTATVDIISSITVTCVPVPIYLNVKPTAKEFLGG